MTSQEVSVSMPQSQDQPRIAYAAQTQMHLLTILSHLQDTLHNKWAGTLITNRLAAKASATGGMQGKVELCAEHVEVGYISHPAMVDSSMHLSIFLGGSDGRTRVPGRPTIP